MPSSSSRLNAMGCLSCSFPVLWTTINVSWLPQHLVQTKWYGDSREENHLWLKTWVNSADQAKLALMLIHISSTIDPISSFNKVRKPWITNQSTLIMTNWWCWVTIFKICINQISLVGHALLSYYAIVPKSLHLWHAHACAYICYMSCEG